MHDVVDLRDFYASRLGWLCERFVGAALAPLWTPITGERLLGFGYATPWLERFGPDAERAFAFMPAGQGAVTWPPVGPCATALVWEPRLPLPDSAMDRVLMVHGLEHARDPRELMDEMWRVLTPEGRLVIVVPNRRGVWARIDATPFGSGRPYSRSQLTRLVRAAGFTPTAWSDALFFAPARWRANERVAALAERTGRRFWPPFAGAIIVEATKRLHRGLPITRAARRPALVPVLAPQGASQGASRVRAGLARERRSGEAEPSPRELP